MSYLNAHDSQSDPQSLERAAAAQRKTRWASSAAPWSAASASGGTSIQAPGGPGGMVRKFSTGYDLWQERGLGPELERESVSPLATKIVDRELAEGIKVLGDLGWGASKPLFEPGVGSKRRTNVPGPLYRVDEQALEAKLKQENKAKWDELNVPIAPALPADEPGKVSIPRLLPDPDLSSKFSTRGPEGGDFLETLKSGTMIPDHILGISSKTVGALIILYLVFKR